MGEVIARKDGESSIRNADGPGVDSVLIDGIVDQHVNLRDEGHSTLEVSSGATTEGEAHILSMGLDPSLYSGKMKAMMGMPSHFSKWVVSAAERSLLGVSSLSTAIELRDSEEGKEIRGGIGEALRRPEILLVANYHDEADPREMTIYEKMLHDRGEFLPTESEENDFHALNLAIAAAAGILMLCTDVEGVKKNGRKLDEIHVDDIDEFIEKYIEEGKVSRGGIKTKLLAAKKGVLDHNMRVVIGHSQEDSRRLLESNTGTWVIQ
jgi:glutamate 5-kinase